MFYTALFPHEFFMISERDTEQYFDIDSVNNFLRSLVRCENLFLNLAYLKIPLAQSNLELLG